MLLLGMFLLVGCSSLKVEVDYDPDFDLASQERFVIVHPVKEGEDTLFSDRVIDALQQELEARSYISSDRADADLVFVFHANVENIKDIDRDYVMVGFGRYGYSGHMMATTRTYEYTRGTLIIDALNPRDNKIVWRGVARDVLKEYDTPQERRAYITKVIQNIMLEFPMRDPLP